MDMELPHVIDIEKELLGAMLVRQGEAIPFVADNITAEDFYRPEHRLIFKAMVSSYENNKPLNVLFLAEELKRTGDLARVGSKYLFALCAASVTNAYVKSQVEAIKETATKRRIIRLAEELGYKAQSTVATVDELMADVEAFLDKSKEAESSTFSSSTTSAVAAYERMTALSKTSDLSGVATGFWDLNDLTNGLQRGELILLAARPSMGKTALALNIAQNAANTNKVVAVFSLEMSELQIAIRLLSSISGVEARKIATGHDLGEHDTEYLLDAIERIERHPIYVDDTSGLSVAAMRMKLRRFKKEHGLDLVVVDYLQLMRGNGENRVQEISGISRGLKAIAKEFDVPVLALSQLSRNVEMRAEKKPQLSDLRDSGSLEQDADIVMFLYRDEYYNRDDDENKNVAELIVAKNRNGATASTELFFRKETMKFEDFIRFSHGKEEEQS